MWAAAQRHPEVVKVLIAHGADIHARSDVWSEMMAVPPHGLPLYNRLIPHGGDTALMFAARVGDPDSAKLLVDAGANVNDADAWGVTATVMAAHAGFADLVELLLDRGADPNAADAGFHRAACRHHAAAAAGWWARCSTHGADANAPVKTWTPTRRSSKDYNFAPGARRRDAVLAGGAVQRARRHAAAAQAWRRRRRSCITPTITTTTRSSRARR